ncbi:hypothetical protein B0H17DRAFT_1256650 [Mycena rosella]|uniref:Major facilitator superfamily (MFS) profile domain-containing protein n=1 Tax=Mycena rosella TaxID=1033263 RepID=A0AAD7CV23_MYCRO|nr:hypothetical protein B0H17DRAFT_1256650 [Mycena rosella]
MGILPFDGALSGDSNGAGLWANRGGNSENNSRQSLTAKVRAPFGPPDKFPSNSRAKGRDARCARNQLASGPSFMWVMADLVLRTSPVGPFPSLWLDDDKLMQVGPAVVWDAGAALGPLLGGFLARPHDNFPRLFSGKFWDDFPYFLPCFAVGGFVLMTCLLALAFLEETILYKKGSSLVMAEASSVDVQNPDTPFRKRSPRPVRELLTFPVIISVSNYYASLAFLFISISAMPIKIGGLNLPPAKIGLILSAYSAATALFQGLFCAKLIQRFGSARVFIAGISMCLPIFVLLPVISAVVLHTGLKPVGIGPAMATSLFSLSLETNLLGGYAVYAVFFSLSVLALLLSMRLPTELWEVVEGPPFIPWQVGSTVLKKFDWGPGKVRSEVRTTVGPGASKLGPKVRTMEARIREVRSKFGHLIAATSVSGNLTIGSIVELILESDRVDWHEQKIHDVPPIVDAVRRNLLKVQVITMYPKNGGKAGAHSFTQGCQNIDLRAFISTTIQEHTPPQFGTGYLTVCPSTI